ncbi:methyltransferase domain-containing protein [Candidatus Pacearchaeota archaeon]|nr:methyltransferase domain-containing protein [Candidatus Pacearchaeota archaeon]
MIPKSFDVLGNIAILKFSREEKKQNKVKIAKQMLKEHKSITTILEKSEKIKGRLRTFKTTYLAGIKTKIALYVENGCRFKFDVEKTYFSPRLSNERNELAKEVKKNEKILVLFAGVAPFSIVIAKLAKPEIVYSVEINKNASKYALENVKINKLHNVRVIQGDAKKVIPKLIKQGIKFDRIIMPRAQLKDTFLSSALKVIKKQEIINYYGFGKQESEIINEIERDVKKAGKKIKIINIKKAGNIAPYKYRWRVDFKVLN